MRRGAPIEAASTGQREPITIFAAPAAHTAHPRTMEAMTSNIVTSDDHIGTGRIGFGRIESGHIDATLVTLPRKNTMAEETSLW